MLFEAAREDGQPTVDVRRVMEMPSVERYFNGLQAEAQMRAGACHSATACHSAAVCHGSDPMEAQIRQESMAMHAAYQQQMTMQQMAMPMPQTGMAVPQPAMPMPYVGGEVMHTQHAHPLWRAAAAAAARGTQPPPPPFQPPQAGYAPQGGYPPQGGHAPQAGYPPQGSYGPSGSPPMAHPPSRPKVHRPTQPAVRFAGGGRTSRVGTAGRGAAGGPSHRFTNFASELLSDAPPGASHAAPGGAMAGGMAQAMPTLGMRAAATLLGASGGSAGRLSSDSIRSIH